MSTKAEKTARANVAKAFVAMREAVNNYCNAYAAANGNPDDLASTIGYDHYAGSEMVDILKSMIALLNCETGGLDGGTEANAIRAIAKRNSLLNPVTLEIEV